MNSSGYMKQMGSAGANYEPKLPLCVIEEEEKLHVNIYGLDKSNPTWGQHNSFNPPNPASVIEEEDTIYGETKEERHQRYLKSGTGSFEPPNPSSVVEEKPKKVHHYEKGECCYGTDIEDNHRHIGKPQFEPPNPASVLEDKWIKEDGKNGHGWDKHKPEYGNSFEPPNPVSVLEDNELDVFDYIENPEDAPFSVVESTKVFIGKRNHQTEKPQDVLEFLIKYWSNEDSTILDPTMGSGSTGVACKKLGRKFIGFELDEKIFKVAKNRIEK